MTSDITVSKTNVSEITLVLYYIVGVVATTIPRFMLLEILIKM